MEQPACPGCRQRDAIIATLQQQLAALEARVRDLEERLGRNSSNSSLPPSANPPDALAPVVKRPTGRKPGAQPGHPAHLRQRLPAEGVQHLRTFVPTHCRRCQTPLPTQAAPPRSAAELAPSRRVGNAPGGGHGVSGPCPHLPRLRRGYPRRYPGRHQSAQYRPTLGCHPGVFDGPLSPEQAGRRRSKGDPSARYRWHGAPSATWKDK